MGVSENGYPQIIHFNRVFHYKPSILGYPYFWKHPYNFYPLSPERWAPFKPPQPFVWLLDPWHKTFLLGTLFWSALPIGRVLRHGPRRHQGFSASPKNSRCRFWWIDKMIQQQQQQQRANQQQTTNNQQLTTSDHKQQQEQEQEQEQEQQQQQQQQQQQLLLLLLLLLLLPPSPLDLSFLGPCLKWN